MTRLFVYNVAKAAFFLTQTLISGETILPLFSRPSEVLPSLMPDAACGMDELCGAAKEHRDKLLAMGFQPSVVSHAMVGWNSSTSLESLVDHALVHGMDGLKLSGDPDAEPAAEPSCATPHPIPPSPASSCSGAVPSSVAAKVRGPCMHNCGRLRNTGKTCCAHCPEGHTGYCTRENVDRD